ncbi:hypothetical protein B4099_1419 [Heyndrickxia coagulans]|uniref:Uncharacterized protein n=1 Tax=Heyndrickxia coagulans TaxID=1398 RepID=A0A150JTY0_HEYCO|nr:hypothetical protein B4099_1419 [Heyndrickxia coagulans]
MAPGLLFLFYYKRAKAGRKRIDEVFSDCPGIAFHRAEFTRAGQKK